MKKFIYLFTAFVALFSFLILFNEESSREHAIKSEIIPAITLEGDKIAVRVALDLENYNEKEFTNDVIEFTESNRYLVTATLSENMTHYSHKVKYFFYSSDNVLLDKIYHIPKTLDIQQDENTYASTDLNDNAAVKIRYLDEKYNDEFYGVMEIHAFSSLNEDPSFSPNNSHSLTFYVDDVESFEKQLLHSNITKYIDENIGVNAFEQHGEEVRKEAMNTILFLVVSIILLLVCVCYAISKSKEIMLMKLFGMRNGYITRAMYLQMFILLALEFLIVQGLASLVLIGRFDSATRFFYIHLLMQFLLFFVCLVIVYIVLFFSVTKIANFNFVKKVHTYKRVISFNYVLKMLTFILLIQPMIVDVSGTIENLKVYNLLHENRSRSENLVYINGINSLDDIGSDEFSFQAIQNKIFRYFDKNGGYFQAFDYNTLQEETTELFQEYKYPYLEANVNYLRDYKIEDINGTIVDIEKLSDETLLIPEEYMNENLGIIQGSDTIIIKNGNIFQRHDVPLNSKSYYKENPIIKVFSSIPQENPMSSSPIAVQLPLKNKKQQDSFEEFLLDNNLKDKVIIGNFSNDYEVIHTYVENKLIRASFLMIIQFMVIFAFLFETIYMVLVDEKKKYALKYTCGDSFMGRYGKLFTSNYVSLAIVLLVEIIIFNGNPISTFVFILIVSIIELLLSLFMIRLFEKKYIANTLKGE